MTPLHHAIRVRPLPSPQTILLLYQAGADVNAQTMYGRTPLHLLCRIETGGAEEAVGDDSKIVSKKKCNAKLTGAESRIKQGTATINHIEPLVEDDIQHHSPLSSESSRLSGPAIQAPFIVKNPSTHLARCAFLLLRLGARVDVKDRYENTALHYAAERGMTEVVRVLVKDGGANLAEKNRKGLRAVELTKGEVKSVLEGMLV